MCKFQERYFKSTYLEGYETASEFKRDVFIGESMVNDEHEDTSKWTGNDVHDDL